MCITKERRLRSSTFSDWIFLVEMENKNKYLVAIVALSSNKKQEEQEEF